MTPRVHDLKTWPEYFAAIQSGAKRFEVRRDDRGFDVGDELHLQEFDPITDQYSGRELTVRVIYVLRGGGWFGVEPGHVVMSIEVMAP